MFLCSHLVHASDADQAEALLTRWGPEGQGKLGGKVCLLVHPVLHVDRLFSDPQWANAIRNIIQQSNQARAVNEVVNALKPSVSTLSRADHGPALRVVNGVSITSTSTITTAARENVSLTPTSPVTPQTPVSPAQTSLGQPGNSTIRWTTGLAAHPEHEHEDAAALDPEKDLPDVPAPMVRKQITPSLATLEKAVSARIFFENLYFPLLRQPPSREQRRLAMERDMANMQLSESQKEYLRGRWRQNETDYLRECRRKVDVSAFVKLKTIGHGMAFVLNLLLHSLHSVILGAFGVVSLVRERSTGQLFAMKQVIGLSCDVARHD